MWFPFHSNFSQLRKFGGSLRGNFWGGPKHNLSSLPKHCCGSVAMGGRLENLSTGTRENFSNDSRCAKARVYLSSSVHPTENFVKMSRGEDSPMQRSTSVK